MTTNILELQHLSKTFIVGNNKRAQKAQKALQELQERYERDISQQEKDKVALEIDEALLREARALFIKQEYEACYGVITGKRVRRLRKDAGIVVHALTDINLDVHRGDLIALVGPSGSGKSTLLNMLGLLDEPTAGRVLLDGRDVTHIKRGELPEIRSKQLGFVFQSFNLIPTLTALENVMLPLRYSGIKAAERKELAKSALEKVGLGSRLHHTPSQLSGGQQQRVAIARSIVNNPAIVFGDELTGELDTTMTAEIMDLITRLNRNGRTFVIVTHNPEVAARCKRIIHLRDGRIEHEEVGEAYRKRSQAAPRTQSFIKGRRGAVLINV
jgi:putative ABC transport system ATP-binding protein